MNNPNHPKLDRLWAFLFLAVMFFFLIWGFVRTRNRYINEINQQDDHIVQLEEQITQLENYIAQQKEAYGGGEEARYGFPIVAEDYVMPTSPYGVRHSPMDGELREHRGVDLLGVWRARVVAIADGVVLDHYLVPDGEKWKGHPTLGGMVRIQHDDGTISVSGHLSWTTVHEGQRVVKGQIIGRQGDTGLSQGEHLHFELWLEGQPVNPLRFVTLP